MNCAQKKLQTHKIRDKKNNRVIAINIAATKTVFSFSDRVNSQSQKKKFEFINNFFSVATSHQNSIKSHYHFRPTTSSRVCIYKFFRMISFYCLPRHVFKKYIKIMINFISAFFFGVHSRFPIVPLL